MKKVIWIVGVAVILVSLLLGLFFYSRQSNKHSEPVKVGFLGVLTGVYSLEGVRAREGIILAIEKQNALGGINGHPIELIIKDDENKTEVAEQAMRDLIDQGVEAILAHSSSTNTNHILPILNESEVLMIRDAGSSLFSGRGWYHLCRPGADRAGYSKFMHQCISCHDYHA